MQLRILARAASLPGEASAEIRDATNAIIAEVEAMSRTALRAAGRQDAQAETFLWVRIARLAAAADRAVDAARNRDIAGLRGHLHQFDTLTSAIWAVQHATYGT
jgi:head-tail adaptor